MFEYLSGFDYVLVSGPQRSGTRIAAHMIANDTGKIYIDESEFCYDDVPSLIDVLVDNRGCVAQCPGVFHEIDKVSKEFSNLAVVVMIRNLADIEASQARIGWKKELKELSKYGRLDGSIAEVKYANWLSNQRRKVSSWFEVNYETLSAHPLWIEKGQRKSFEACQWQLGQN